LEDTPVLCQSFDIFAAIFGGETTMSETPTAVKAFFDEGGTQLVFVRVLPSDAIAADGRVRPDASNSGQALVAPNTPAGTTIIGLALLQTPVVPGTIIIFVGGLEAGRDNGNGGFFGSGASPKLVLSGTINYTTGAITLTFTAALAGGVDALTADFYNFAALETWDIDARSRGAWGNDVRVKVQRNVNASTVNAGTTLTPVPTGASLGPFTVTIPAAQRPIIPGTVLVKVDGEQAGNDISTPDSAGLAVLTGSGTSPSQVVPGASSINYETGVVTVFFTTFPPNASLITVDFTQLDRLDVIVSQRDASTGVFGVREQFTALDFVSATSPQYVKAIIGGDQFIVGPTTYPAQTGTSQLLKWREGADFPATPSTLNTVTLAMARGLVGSVEYALNNQVSGSDGSVNTDGTIKLKRTDATHPSLDVPGNERGIYAFKKVTSILNLAVPDLVGSTSNITPLDTAQVLSDELRFAVASTNRFVVGVVPLSLNAPQAVSWKQGTLMPLLQGISSPSIPAKLALSFLSIYYPHIKVRDVNTGQLKVITPIGHILGVYARTDASKNVGKAPAGVLDGALQTAVDISVLLSQTDKDMLYQNGINLIVNDPATGLCVFGARTLFVPQGTSDPDGPFLFVPGRRTFMFVEQSAKDALQLFVFENNGPQTWSRVSMLLESFLTDLHNQGVFAGRTPAESFTVTCNDTNNSQVDINAGRMNVKIGIATNRPAEFIVITLQQQVIPS
jgi:phage tail sheath protein FI